MNPKQFLEKYPEFCGISCACSPLVGPTFYVKKDWIDFYPETETNDFLYEPFYCDEFSNGSLKDDMVEVEKWIHYNLQNKTLSAFNIINGWVWGEAPNHYFNIYQRIL